MQSKIKKTYYDPDSRGEWLELRNTFFFDGMVGGSDMATILHANPYKSAIELFYQAIGFTPVSTMINEKMCWGIELEDKIADMYQYWDDKTQDWIENYKAGNKQRKLRRVNAIITNKKYPAMFGNLDREIMGDPDTVIEIKNMNGFVLDSYKEAPTHPLFILCPPGLPTGYYAQVQNYLAVTDRKKALFVLLRDGQTMIVIDVGRDEYLIEQMNLAAIDFQARVEKGKEIMAKYQDENMRLALLSKIEPALTDQDTYGKFRAEQLSQRKLEDEKKTKEGTVDQYRAALRYSLMNHKIKELTKIKTKMGNFLKTEFLANAAETFDFGRRGKITYGQKLSIAGLKYKWR